jgi:hypothetical protein
MTKESYNIPIDTQYLLLILVWDLHKGGTLRFWTHIPRSQVSPFFMGVNIIDIGVDFYK